MIFFGGLYPKEIEKEVYQKNIRGIQNAANQLQWSLIHGLDQNLSKPVKIFNMMYIGSYPKNYRDAIIKSFQFSHNGKSKDYNIGFFNITVIKEIFRYLALLRPLKKWMNRQSKLGKVVVIYSVQNLWLSAVKILKKHNQDIHICLIVPDLPDYMSMSRDGFWLNRLYKKYSIHKCRQNMKYIDSFVFLTEHMKDYFQTDKPFVVIEGIVPDDESIEEKIGIPNKSDSNQKMKTVLYTGSLEKAYGVLDLVTAFLTIKSEDYRLIICGEGEAKKDILQAADTDHRIRYMGMLGHADILKLQKESTVLINPRKNRDEYTKYSFPSKILEYLSSGTPVIAYKLDGIPKEYDDFIYYMNGDRIEDIAGRIIEVCEKSQEERNEFGRKACSFVRVNKNSLVQVKKITEMISKSVNSYSVGKETEKSKMKVLHINCAYNFGSTGKIINDINHYLTENGQESFVCYSLGKRSKDKNAYKIAYRYETAIYKRISYLFGMQYAIAVLPTLRLFYYIKKIKPDVIHLHSINCYMVNIYMLFEFLAKYHYKTVVTNHAEFLYTGNCDYAYECDRWKLGCGKCPRLKDATGSRVFDTTAYAFRKMQKAFAKVNNITIVSVSGWVLERAKISPIMNKLNHAVIFNGIDTENTFYPQDSKDLRTKLKLTDEKVILHVTSCFTEEDNRKGGKYILQLAEMLKDYPYKFVIIASTAVTKKLPDNIILIGRVTNQKQLAKYYSLADLAVITSRKETYSMPVAEALSCGTPVIGFMAGGPETIALKDYSEFVEYADIDALKECLLRWIERKEEMKDEIASAAEQMYGRKHMVERYMQIYEK